MARRYWQSCMHKACSVLQRYEFDGTFLMQDEEVKPEIFSVNGKGNKETVGCKRKAKSFRDEEYFISSVLTNQRSEAGLSIRAEEGFGLNRLDSAVMDLIADDKEGMQKQKSIYHWDKRSKKYIKLNHGERATVTGKVKTGGKKVKAQKTGIYSKWKASTHNVIGLERTDHEGQSPPSVGLAGGRFNRRFKGCKQQRYIPNAHVPSEIKDLEQIRKQRQKNQQACMKNNSRKGNKFGNGKKRKGK